jgi:hypothetical protein
VYYRQNINKFTNSKEKSPVSQEILPRPPLRNPKVHYRGPYSETDESSSHIPALFS